jgi:hypothetical protein
MVPHALPIITVLQYLILQLRYTQGGFIDEYGSEHASDHEYDFQWWEVLNEVEAEHGMSASTYTRIYDAIVAGIRLV